MISVCLATYNGEEYIRDQLYSILSQLRSDDEIILSDDSSTDNTLQLVRAINDPRINIYPNQTFRDPIKNFQNALSHAKGDFIFLSDQDDVWLEGKVKVCIDLLCQYDLVVTDSIIVDEKLNQLEPSFFAHINSGKGIIRNMIKSTYYGSCMAFRKTVLDVALPFPDTKEIGHDLWLGWVAEMIGEVCFLQKPYVLYRRHEQTFTLTGRGKSKRSFAQMLMGRLIMIKELSRFYIKYKKHAG